MDAANPQNRIRGATAAALLSALLLCGSGAAQAAEIRLLSAASMQTVLKDLIGEFERDSGHKVIVHYSTMGAITDRVTRGEEADLVISSPASIASLVTAGRINAASEVSISRTGVGIVVPSGGLAPVVSDVDGFKRALLGAKAVVYANPAGGGAAGIHIARVIEKLGIAGEVGPKTTLAKGGDVTEVTLGLGEGALGMTQVSEIVGKPGAQFVQVPEELQNYTGFVAGTPAGAKKSQAVDSFIAFLRTPRAIAVMKEKGMRVD
jgi:molybdate transport system substrate-binding protein